MTWECVLDGLHSDLVSYRILWSLHNNAMGERRSGFRSEVKVMEKPGKVSLNYFPARILPGKMLVVAL